MKERGIQLTDAQCSVLNDIQRKTGVPASHVIRAGVSFICSCWLEMPPETDAFLTALRDVDKELERLYNHSNGDNL